MGKASKWSINFLLGRKREKNKKEKTGFSEADVNDFPVKRRWSFGRSPSKGKSNKGFLKSLESNPVAEKGTVGLGNPKNDILAFGGATYAQTGTAFVRNEASTTFEDAAATRIQAVFRSYLARKALYALRALVKLQALVRGHLVRKQTSTILKRMHALMAIQVRARFHRIQMAEESQFVGRSQSSRYRNIPQDEGIRRIHSHREAINTRIEHGVTIYHPGNLSISKSNHQYLEELSFSPPHNTPQRYYCSISKTIPGGVSLSCEQRSYKAKTKSSGAKVRPKQQLNERMTADE